MSRLFVVALLALLSVSICDCANLTAVTWKHDINLPALLDDALKTSQAIVTNVKMGYHKGSFEEDPVIDQIGPTSNFSLDEFITQTIEYHNKNAQHVKIIQLNFSTIKALRKSIDILLVKHKEITFPIWLHADIVNGPGSDVWQDPINGTQFIEKAKRMVNLVLSIGWKTYWSPNSEDVYTWAHTQGMKEIIKNTKINTPDYKDVSISFPIRAAFALKSQALLRNFYEGAKKTNPITYTIQSLAGDIVDPQELQSFIFSYGVENVYIDLPKDLRDQMNLISGGSSLIHFGFLNSIMLIIGYFIRNGFH